MDIRLAFDGSVVAKDFSVLLALGSFLRPLWQKVPTRVRPELLAPLLPDVFCPDPLGEFF